MKFKKWIIIGVVVFVALILLSSSIYTVKEGEYVFVTQFGAIQRTETQAGIKLKIPFVEDVNRLISRQMVYNVNPSEVLTADKKAMIVDSYSIWRIHDVTTFIRTVGNINEMQKRIDASVYSVIKNLMGNLQQSEIIADTEAGRMSLNQQITEQVANNLKGYGVEVRTVEIKRYDLPSDNTDAVFDRMISERAQMAESFKAEGEYEAAKIRNETDKEIGILLGEARAEAQKLKGEGEEEYMRILKDLYESEDKAAFYVYVRELEALSLSMRGDKTIIIGPDSPLAKILNNQSGFNP